MYLRRGCPVYKVEEFVDNREVALFIGTLIQDSFRNLLLLGDLSAPMNKVSRAFKVTHGGEFQTGFTIFDGADVPVIVFPHGMTEYWLTIRNYVDTLGYDEIMVIYPSELEDDSSIPTPPPWLGWNSYNWELDFIDDAMRFTKEELEIRPLPEDLPEIKAAKLSDAERISEFFRKEVTEDPAFGHWFIPEQLESEMSVIAEDSGEIVAFAGTHFETPYTVQIGNVYVKPEYRGRGIGRAVTTAVTLGIIRTKRVPTLFVNESNEIARKLYESMGFEIYNRFSFYRGKR